MIGDSLCPLLLAVAAVLFSLDVLTATTQIFFWFTSFFFASAGASSARFAVSETFPDPFSAVKHDR